MDVKILASDEIRNVMPRVCLTARFDAGIFWSPPEVTTMRNRTALLSMVGWLLAVVSVPVVAHHSFSAEYDATKPVKVSGVLTRVEWTNPHIWFYLDVKERDGTVTSWGFSAAPPGVLQRRGIPKSVLKVGSVINVEGFRARDGSTNASGGTVTFADGKRVFTAAAEDAVPKDSK